MMQTEQQPQHQNQLTVQNSGSLSFSSHLSKEDEEISKSALSTFRAKEEEIEKKKMEVREKVQLQLGRVEEETKRLAMIREVCSIKIFLFFSQSKTFSLILTWKVEFLMFNKYAFGVLFGQFLQNTEFRG